MIEDMEGGKVLSQCMAAHPEVFDNVFVSLVGAGEQAGQLPEVFQNLAETLKWQDELTSQTTRLLMYPALVLVVVLGVLMFLLIYLVPQIAQLFKTMGIALPIQTRVLIAVSNFVVALLAAHASACPSSRRSSLIVAIRAAPRIAYLWDYAKLRLPVVGPILQKIILSRFANVFRADVPSPASPCSTRSDQRGHRRQPGDLRRPEARRRSRSPPARA